MLSHLLKVDQRIFQSSTYGSHTTESSALQLLALKQRLRIFQEANVVTGDGLDEVLCGGELTKSNSEVVRIVQRIQQILVCSALSDGLSQRECMVRFRPELLTKWMDILKAGKSIEDGRDLLGECLLGELDLASIEC